MVIVLQASLIETREQEMSPFSASREEKKTTMQVDGVKFKQTWERNDQCLEFSTGDVF